PTFHELVVRDPVDLSNGNGEVFPGGLEVSKRADMRDLECLVEGHHVTLRDEKLGHRVEFEGREILGKQLLERLAAAHRPRGWQTTHVEDNVWRAQLVRHMYVPGVALLFPTQDELLVDLCSHGISLFLSTLERIG